MYTSYIAVESRGVERHCVATGQHALRGRNASRHMARMMTNIGACIHHLIASAYMACNFSHLWLIREKAPATDLPRKVCAPRL